jgi:hypothetical protein
MAGFTRFFRIKFSRHWALCRGRLPTPRRYSLGHSRIFGLVAGPSPRLLATSSPSEAFQRGSRLPCRGTHAAPARDDTALRPPCRLPPGSASALSRQALARGYGSCLLPRRLLFLVQAADALLRACCFSKEPPPAGFCLPTSGLPVSIRPFRAANAYFGGLSTINYPRRPSRYGSMFTVSATTSPKATVSSSPGAQQTRLAVTELAAVALFSRFTSIARLAPASRCSRFHRGATPDGGRGEICLLFRRRTPSRGSTFNTVSEGPGSSTCPRPFPGCPGLS